MPKQTSLKEELYLWPENFPTIKLTLQHLVKRFFLIKVNLLRLAVVNLFWSGHRSEERREAGVGFAIRAHRVKKLSSIHEGLKNCLMTLQLPLAKNVTVKLIGACDPTMTNPEETKDKFHKELDAVLSAVLQSEKLIVLGGFSPVNLGIFEAQHQTNCNRIVFNAI